MILPNHVANPDPNIYLSDDFTTLDVETTNKQKGDPQDKDNSLLMVAYKIGHGPTHLDGADEYHLNPAFLSHLEDGVDFIVAHNAKFDIAWLARAGLDLSKIVVWDTMIAEYVIAGNMHVPLSLDATLARYGLGQKDNFISSSIKGGVCPSDLPDSLLCKYAKTDVDLTYQLFLAQRQRIFEEGLEGTLYTHCLFTPVLADIESKGMQLDCERVNIVTKKVRDEYEATLATLVEFAPDTNFNSPIQVADLLYDVLKFDEPTDRKGEPIRTATGRRKADIATISSLKAKNKKQRTFVELYHKIADLSAKLEKALVKMETCCIEDGGLMYGSFNQTVTRTHRLSSNGKKYKIQFQNMFREFKSLFTAQQEGWLVGEVDEAQLEFRAAAFLGQDKQAMYDIEHGVDVHQITADTITKAGQPISRQEAKARTFKPLFGGSSGTKAEMVYYEDFKRRYSGIAYTQEHWAYSVLRNKYLELPTGLRFHWPNVRQDRSGYITNTTNIFNYPIQYLATGEIVPIAVTMLWHRLRAAGARTYLVNTIHDSAIAEVHPSERELFEELAVKTFTFDVYVYLKEVYGIDFNVPLEAEVKIASHWSESEAFREKWL